MLRVCGITFDHTSNYGSALQSYALQTVVENMRIGEERCSYALVPLALLNGSHPKEQTVSSGRSFSVRVKRFILSRMGRYRRRQFAGFERKKLHFADCISREELFDVGKEYDAYVCGSDVIWNFLYTHGETAYFLDFTDKYKFSYAASFGKAVLDFSEDKISLPEPPEAIYRRGISALDDVSVREEYGVALAERFTDKHVSRTLDPTLLLSAVDWSRLAKGAVPKEKYIFAYCTSTRPNYVNFLRMLKSQTGLPVINVAWLSKDSVAQRTLAFPTPERWIALLKNAEYVVTNSFHGTAFSVLFHKKFYTAVQDGKNVRSNVRLYDFLEGLGLSERLKSETPETIDLSAPDFTEADRVLSAQREESLAFLRRNLENAARIKKEGGKALPDD